MQYLVISIKGFESNCIFIQTLTLRKGFWHLRKNLLYYYFLDLIAL